MDVFDARPTPVARYGPTEDLIAANRLILRQFRTSVDLIELT